MSSTKSNITGISASHKFSSKKPFYDVTSPEAGMLFPIVNSTTLITIFHSGYSDNVVVDHIVLEWSPNGTDTWTTLSSDVSYPYPHSGLSEATTYYYRATVHDAAGNNSTTAVVNATTGSSADVTAPVVMAFVIPATHTSIEIPITPFTATDAVGVNGYLITESATPPGENDPGWTGTAPTTYTVSGDGAHTLYGWAKDAAGNVSDSLNDTCTVTVTAFANVEWYDDFNYTVTRGSVTDPLDNPFVNTGPWTRCKSYEWSVGAGGYIYTVDATTDIPGNSVAPSESSDRAICFEGISGTLGGTQTDFYVQRGLDSGASDPDTVWPANVWTQHWMYIPRSGSQMSQTAGQMKIYYPCRGGHGSCSTMSAILIFKGYSVHTLCASVSSTVGMYPVDVGDNNLNDDFHDLTPAGDCIGEGDGPFERGVRNSSHYFSFNTWYLVKYHLDTSTINGKTEMWIREYGSATWTKVLDWVDGENGYTFTVPVGNRIGHSMLRIPTTWDTNNCWMYWQDYEVATSEANLDTYSDA